MTQAQPGALLPSAPVPVRGVVIGSTYRLLLTSSSSRDFSATNDHDAVVKGFGLLGIRKADGAQAFRAAGGKSIVRIVRGKNVRIYPPLRH